MNAPLRAILAITLGCAAIGASATDAPIAPRPAASPPSAQSRCVPRRSFRGVDTSSAYISARDGTRLAAELYLPHGLKTCERIPTILHQTRYYRAVDVRMLLKPFLGSRYLWTEKETRKQFVRAGYAWLDVDIRGTGASFGSRPFPMTAEEVTDGADLADWITNQPWSDGQVGATGISYDGCSAEMLLRNAHEAVRAVAPRFSGWDVYSEVFYPGGVPLASLIRDLAALTGPLDRNAIGEKFGFSARLTVRGVRPVDRDLLPLAIAEHAGNVDLTELISALPHRDDTYAGTPVMIAASPHEHRSEIATADAAILSFSGWFDGAYARSAIRRHLHGGNDANRLIIGPWFHGETRNASPRAKGGGDADEAALLLSFFERHLRGPVPSQSDTPPIQYYTMGREQWSTSSTWPPPEITNRNLYFAASGLLDWTPPTSTGSADAYQVDVGVGTGTGARWTLVAGTALERKYGNRKNVDQRLLTYTTAPLAADLEVTGHPLVVLHLASSSPDGAVFAYLEDVEPDGDVVYVTEGQLRLAFRDPSPPLFEGDPVPFRAFRRQDVRPLAEGEVAELAFDLLPTSYQFRRGHSLRIAIAGADADHFAPLTAAGTRYEIFRDSLHPSRISLPIMPAEARTASSATLGLGRPSTRESADEDSRHASHLPRP